MSLLIGFLTFILVVNCLFLILLVLVQLPKKEAGAGLAFGAGAVDTLIGAGSGNALTKITKYAAGAFLGLAVVLAVLNAQRHQGTSRSLQQELAKKSSAAPMLPSAPANTPAAAPTTGHLTTSNPPAALSLTSNIVPVPANGQQPAPAAQQPTPQAAPAGGAPAK
jgi:protein translocase SecG subunit